MYPTYFEGASLDRVDNDKGYSKSNCRWATGLVQSRNKSTTVLTEELVTEAKRLYATGLYSQREVGIALGGVKRDTVKHVLKGLL